MLRKVKLYGELADFVGHKELDAVINCTADAIRFLITNFEGLEAHMANRHYQVLVGKEDIDETELHDLSGTQEIKFVPVISGAGSGFGRFIFGAALIGASFLFPGAGAFGGGSAAAKAAAAASPFMAGVGTFVSVVGASLALQGVNEMLFPLPEPDLEGDPRVSFSFSGLQNTSRAGTPVPICYGEILTGSVVISGDITTDEVEV